MKKHADGQPTACFFFIVKSDIEFYVCSVAKTTIYISPVGVGAPMFAAGKLA